MAQSVNMVLYTVLDILHHFHIAVQHFFHSNMTRIVWG